MLAHSSAAISDQKSDPLAPLPLPPQYAPGRRQRSRLTLGVLSAISKSERGWRLRPRLWKGPRAPKCSGPCSPNGVTHFISAASRPALRAQEGPVFFEFERRCKMRPPRGFQLIQPTIALALRVV